MAKTRTFIAVEASPEIKGRAAALADRLAPLAPGVRWVDPVGMHFTLQFLGDITDQEIADVCTRVGRAAAGRQRFLLEARGAGAFPATDRPKTLWIGVGAGGDELRSLQSDIEASLEGLGFRGENRRFVPHLTIGKTNRAPVAAVSPQLAGLGDYEAGAMTVTEVTVYASQLTREGPEYHALARCPLST